MSSERLEVSAVTCQDSAARLGKGDHERVRSRTATRATSQCRRPASDRWADFGLHDARLQETVRIGVTGGVALQRLD